MFGTMIGSCDLSGAGGGGVVRDREDWHAAGLGLKRVDTTEQQQEVLQKFNDFVGLVGLFSALDFKRKLNFVSFFDGVQVK